MAIGSAVAVLVAAGAAGGAYYVLHTRGTPQETASRFTAAWSRGDTAAMKTELAAPAPGFDAAYAELTRNLGASSVAVTGVRVTTTAGDRATASYTVTARLKNVGDWTYQGRLPLRVKDHYWKVDWTPAAVHPALAGGGHLSIKTTWPQRAAITDANGDRIDGGDVGGSVQQLVGYLAKATAKDVKKLGAAYRPGDAIGAAGLQAAFQKRLAGTPTTRIQVTGAHPAVLHTIDGEAGEELRTTLDLRVQRSAADAVRDVEKPASLVAIRPSSGEILAVVNNKGGFNRALDGNYAPGSTFKTITAAGLLAEGLTPQSKVTCPKQVKVGGLDIRNSDHEAFGSLSFLDSYAHSCNTTFAPLAADKLGAQKLYDLATAFGFNLPLNIGVPATQGSMPKATSDAELGAEAFGQARITASPLVMATVAAAVADGSWRPPTLVPDLKQKTSPKSLPDGVAEQLRAMMRAVVTKGTAHAAGLPAGTAGKTGTAEFGTGPKLDTHAWFIGFRGDLAFAVVVEGGGMGGDVAAPIATAFLKGLG
ncbi:penicillin-binding transpeptidase domain-containing protein [Microbispora oryzae]|uniref:penicillin-binding transpeptidase domain-containing protein n=1 Tax=Microbispora oryzae TaxID=2806554 RepID=UPI0027DDF280|nr:penicillin-binding transpeptidase domain-containing protein [Microbispora oryzae]